MGAIAFLVLFVLGFLLATAGGIVGLVDAFRVSPVWGLLSLLVPFALLVYCIKFWGRKWARNSLIMSLGGLGVMLLSTPLLGAFLAQRASQVGTAPVEENIPIESIPVEPAPDEQASNGEEFAEPLVPVAPQLSPIAQADLIQSTDPNERLQQISNSRPDPFASVPIPPPPQVVAPPTPPGAPSPSVATATPAGNTSGGGGSSGGASGGSGGTSVAAAPGQAGSGAGTSGTTSGGATSGGGTQPTTPPLAPLPALPQPTLAEAVMVTGVMTIGNENFAVVETATGSQYVKAGQRVSNGQVLVKRIDMRGNEPSVVLEQNGIEVTRSVGTSAPAADQPAA